MFLSVGSTWRDDLRLLAVVVLGTVAYVWVMSLLGVLRVDASLVISVLLGIVEVGLVLVDMAVGFLLFTRFESLGLRGLATKVVTFAVWIVGFCQAAFG